MAGRRNRQASAGGRTALLVLPSALTLVATVVSAQEITPDPKAWRPLSFVDLRQPAEVNRTYFDIWRDAIDANNRHYAARGDTRFVGSNAPATEAHYVIWSPRKSVVVSILNTAAACTLKDVSGAAGASVKLCPLRLAVYEGVTVRTLEGGKACFLELAGSPKPTDPTRAASYASYDPAGKTVRLGLVIDHRPVDGCSIAVPITPR